MAYTYLTKTCETFGEERICWFFNGFS